MEQVLCCKWNTYWQTSTNYWYHEQSISAKFIRLEEIISEVSRNKDPPFSIQLNESFETKTEKYPILRKDVYMVSVLM